MCGEDRSFRTLRSRAQIQNAHSRATENPRNRPHRRLRRWRSSAPGHGTALLRGRARGAGGACGGRWTQHEAQKCAGAHQPVLLAASRHYRRERTKAGANWYAHSEALRSRVRCAVLPDWRPVSRAGCAGKADGFGRLGERGAGLWVLPEAGRFSSLADDGRIFRVCDPPDIWWL